MRHLEKEDVQQKLPEVIGWLKKRKSIPNENEEKFRREIINVLGKLGDNSAVIPLSEILNEGALFKANLLIRTKEAALNALAEIGTPEAIEALNQATQHKDQFVASTAQKVLKKFEKETAESP
ncbi:hypothetical protein BXT86_03465 [candidate division WOR-3 bacterium 4484_100]|uniref:HEAT repeat domain-containing protein n=1 Tax=candidate division WOR-3 bacterium 4484_100 TaxID=1936077 RepID=A0A1V4QG76_UNCW3|nr:MAG: hypothetical protein BXT86_03465 [candidate division WOR-3 bacterium 4484_100]